MCLNCGNIIEKWASKYCSNQCQRDYEYKEYIERWKQGKEKGGNDFNIAPAVRRYLFEKYESKCTRCGWAEINPHTGKIPLEVEHISGDWRDNREDNLTLLCPNCHSLSSTYRGLNRGKGRYKNLKSLGKSVFG